jgi:hypothetical protein
MAEESGLPEVDLTVVVRGFTADSTQQLEEDFFTYLANLKRTPMPCLPVTFWNE